MSTGQQVWRPRRRPAHTQPVTIPGSTTQEGIMQPQPTRETQARQLTSKALEIVAEDLATGGEKVTAAWLRFAAALRRPASGVPARQA